MTRNRLLWPFALYFLIFSGVAAYGPYMVLYFQSLAFSGTQIGLLTGIAPLIPLVSLPLLTGFADRTDNHRSVLGLSALGFTAGLIFFPLAKSFVTVFGMVILVSISFSAVLALASNASMFMLGENKEIFGRVRLGGTIGFSIVATIAGVLVENYGLRIAFWSAAVFIFGAFLVSQKLEHGSEEPEEEIERGRPLDLLQSPYFLLFMVLGLAGGISFSTLNSYLFPFMKTLGAEESLMGLALTIGTFSEIPILFFADRLVKRIGAYGLVILSVSASILRLLLLAIAPNPLIVLFIQLLNGFNQPLLTVAGVIYADQLAPEGYSATSQGLFNLSYSAIGAAIGGFVGGILFESVGGRTMYLILGGGMAVLVIAVTLIRRALPPEQHLQEASA